MFIFIFDVVFPTLNLIPDSLVTPFLDFLDVIFYQSTPWICLSLLIAFTVNLFVFVVGYSSCPKHRVGGTLTYTFSFILDLMLIEAALFFPLYLYGNRNAKSFNINPCLSRLLDKAFGQKIALESVFNYIYSVLYSSVYRDKYEEFLKSDFPRIPFTTDHKAFSKMEQLGSKLIELHLLSSEVLNHPIVKFQGQADNKIDIMCRVRTF